MPGALVYAEVTADGAHPVALELLTHARAFGGPVSAVALGPGATVAADELGAHGAATVYASDDPVFARCPGPPGARAAPGGGRPVAATRSAPEGPRCAGRPGCSANTGSSEA